MRKLLFAMILMQGCVTIKMDCKCEKSTKQGSVTPFNNGTILTPSTNVPNLTFPVWNINERVVVSLVKTVHHSEIPDWLKNCDTTFKN